MEKVIINSQFNRALLSTYDKKEFEHWLKYAKQNHMQYTVIITKPNQILYSLRFFRCKRNMFDFIKINLSEVTNEN